MSDIASFMSKTARQTFKIYQDPPIPEDSPDRFPKPFVPAAVFFLGSGPGSSSIYTIQLWRQDVQNWTSTSNDLPHLHPLEPDLSASILGTVLDRRCSQPLLRYLAISIVKHHSYWLNKAHYARTPDLRATYDSTLQNLVGAYSTTLQRGKDPSAAKQEQLRTAEHQLTRDTFYEFPVFLRLVHKVNNKLLDEVLDAYDDLVRTPRNESKLQQRIADGIWYKLRHDWIETYELDLDVETRLGPDEHSSSNFVVQWLADLEGEREELEWDLFFLMRRLREREGRRLRDITNVVAGGGWGVHLGEWPPLADATGVENENRRGSGG